MLSNGRDDMRPALLYASYEDSFKVLLWRPSPFLQAKVTHMVCAIANIYVEAISWWTSLYLCLTYH